MEKLAGNYNIRDAMDSCLFILMDSEDLDGIYIGWHLRTFSSSLSPQGEP
jgi:hypothetical protein